MSLCHVYTYTVQGKVCTMLPAKHCNRVFKIINNNRKFEKISSLLIIHDVSWKSSKLPNYLAVSRDSHTHTLKSSRISYFCLEAIKMSKISDVRPCLSIVVLSVKPTVYEAIYISFRLCREWCACVGFLAHFGPFPGVFTDTTKSTVCARDVIHEK